MKPFESMRQRASGQAHLKCHHAEGQLEGQRQACCTNKTPLHVISHSQMSASCIHFQSLGSMEYGTTPCFQAICHRNRRLYFQVAAWGQGQHRLEMQSSWGSTCESGAMGADVTKRHPAASRPDGKSSWAVTSSSWSLTSITKPKSHLSLQQIYHQGKASMIDPMISSMTDLEA